MKYIKQLQLTFYGQRILRRRLLCTKVTHTASDLNVYQEESRQENHKIVPLFKKSLLCAQNAYIRDYHGQYFYWELYANSKRLSRQISNICDSGSNSTIAFFPTNDVLSVLIMWAIWMSGQKALPLKPNQPLSELKDLLELYGARLIMATDSNETHSYKLACDKGLPLINLDHKFLRTFSLNMKEEILLQKTIIMEDVLFNQFHLNTGALFVYINGSALMWTHKELYGQLRKSSQAWSISHNDKILYITPSFNNYIDECLYNLIFPLSVGSQLTILQPFDSKKTWNLILGLNTSLRERFNVIMAEPEVYDLLVKEYNQMFSGDSKMIQYIKEYCSKNIRLMMSCFTKMEASLFSKWYQITGHSLLESGFSNIMNLNSKQAMALRGSQIGGLQKQNISLRIIDQNDKVLLDLKSTEISKYMTGEVLIGKLMISKDNGFSYSHTGEIVILEKGVLKKLGRYGIGSSNSGISE